MQLVTQKCEDKSIHRKSLFDEYLKNEALNIEDIMGMACDMLLAGMDTVSYEKGGSGEGRGLLARLQGQVYNFVALPASFSDDVQHSVRFVLSREGCASSRKTDIGGCVFVNRSCITDHGGSLEKRHVHQSRDKGNTTHESDFRRNRPRLANRRDSQRIPRSSRGNVVIQFSFPENSSDKTSGSRRKITASLIRFRL